MKEQRFYISNKSLHFQKNETMHLCLSLLLNTVLQHHEKVYSYSVVTEKYLDKQQIKTQVLSSCNKNF